MWVHSMVFKFKLSYDQWLDGWSVLLSGQSGTCDQFFFLSTEIIFRYLQLILVRGSLSDERMDL
jgi:hypothetical protein